MQIGSGDEGGRQGAVRGHLVACIPAEGDGLDPRPQAAREGDGDVGWRTHAIHRLRRNRFSLAI